MKIVHVVEEVSQRNTSIVSVVKIISSYNFLKNKSKIITSDNSQKIREIITLRKIYSNFFYFSEIYKLLIRYKPDLVHIHGMWRPIQFLFILYCQFLNIPILIQPHGMLLKEAMRSKSLVSYMMKLLTLQIYKYLLKNKGFIAVTDEEKVSIKKYFLSPKVDIIRNPLSVLKEKTNKVKKNFIYFGRINSHKNLEEFIRAFIQAKPSNEWCFHIYGIEDDLNYKSKLIKIVNDSGANNYIKFLKPEFNKKKKFKIISESWCNVLTSKSEILSLSVLEAFGVGTPSLVNEKISFPKWIEKFLIKSSIETSTLANSIKKVMKIDKRDRILMRKGMESEFQKRYKTEKIAIDYKNCLSDNINSNKLGATFRKTSILLAYLLNSGFVPFLILGFVLIGSPTTATEISVFPGILMLLTQLFSANARSLLIYNDDKEFYNKAVSTRTIIGLIFTSILCAFHYYFINNSDFTLLLVISLIVYLSWINELNLSIHEKIKSILLIKIFSFFNIFFYLIIFYDFLFSRDNFNLYINYYLCFQFAFAIYHIDTKFINLRKITSFVSNYLNDKRAIASSFFNMLAIIIWRISLIFLLGKAKAGIFLAAFAIASFPGSLLNNIFAQVMMVDKNAKFFIGKIFKVLSVVLLIILGLMIFLNNYYGMNNTHYDLVNITLVSLLGMPIMLYSVSKRHEKLFQSKPQQNKIFFKDVLYGITISPIILILYKLGDENFIIYAYVMSALISAFYYRIIR